MDSLIRILRQNSAISRADIARQLGQTEAAVTVKIEQLEREGTILGYQAVINREQWDADRVTAVIEVRVEPGLTALTRILMGASERARPRVTPMMAAFEAT